MIATGFVNPLMEYTNTDCMEASFCLGRVASKANLQGSLEHRQHFDANGIIVCMPQKSTNLGPSNLDAQKASNSYFQLWYTVSGPRMYCTVGVWLQNLLLFSLIQI